MKGKYRLLLEMKFPSSSNKCFGIFFFNFPLSGCIVLSVGLSACRSLTQWMTRVMDFRGFDSMDSIDCSVFDVAPSPPAAVKQHVTLVLGAVRF